ncbi:putative disease resistance protein RGA3 [Cornus florida]|uniref:putative disease resistance protein RGA3 n=1 Tax=Cornus florida TaxID=4283 RepID=UPI00289D0D4F|nr:putative disease resistance protein RGA3 [Cornus florida]XP_059640583.1 putative disease resistance protein RGA3 [Cornus florida]XP_059640584.1 putative disease resistance protein RGA3 [Cornus florida]XP_059640585.1 putative disease resistance protein RGA3 [Cornus florida]XP_059640586.1 putative disease resistance protein RGA3 [Cornus florida]XP_059640587.1 putative disease resistance protein RGA3 [Cornus florida]XP_059640588.1 putative disease resistance protein RGA3 [Cornus florida]XP_0
MDSDRRLVPVPNQAEIEGAFQRLQAEVPHSIINEILQKLSSPALKELGLEWGLKDELEKLGNIVSTSALYAVNTLMENQGFAGSLTEFIDAVYDADDLVDDFSTEALQRRVVTQNNWAKKVHVFFSSSNQLAFRFKMGRKFKKNRKTLYAKSPMPSQLDQNNIISSNMYNKGEEISSFFMSTAQKEVIFGREKDKLKIVEKLLGEDGFVVSVIGEEGIGKTAVAKLVYNDEQVTNHFQLKMWVCVSHAFDVKIIAKEMIESAIGGGGRRKLPSKLLHHDVDGVALQDRLRKEIDRKRFLLVLDDVQNEETDSWRQLKDLLVGGERGSKILLTSRNIEDGAWAERERPHFTYRLTKLSNYESWSFIKKMEVFKQREEQGNLHEDIYVTANIVLPMCKGLPLALRALRGPLHTHADDKLLDDLKNLQHQHDKLPMLRLNYNYLPSYLKRCFEFCSLYTKGHVIYKKDLIQLWIARGLVQPLDKNPDLEAVGDLYFQDLLRKSFFQDVERDEWGDIVSCKMHPRINDLAALVAGKENVVLHHEYNSTIHHVSYDPSEDSSLDILAQLCGANKIRTFLLHGQRVGFGEPTKLVSDILELSRLRVLDLHCLGIKTVPSCIGKLQYLRYLDLSENCAIKSLPSSITTLQNLQTLKLSCCCHLEELPRETKKLVSLRHLELDGCIGLTHMPCGLGQLTSLRTLTFFILDRENIASKLSGGLSELKGLNNLRGELMIERLGRPCSASTATEEAKIEGANYLKGKQHLQSLQLKWANEVDGLLLTQAQLSAEDDIFEALQPHPNLKRLSVAGYGNLSFPSWMMNTGLHLPNLVKITIADCSRCKQIPKFGQLQSLQVLELSQLVSVEYIDNISSTNAAFGGVSATFFPSLKKLLLNGLTNLKGWWSSEAKEPIAFRSLSVSTIQNCPKLVSLPLHPCVEELDLMRVSEKLVQQFTMMATPTIPTDPMLPSSSSSSSSPVPVAKLKSLCIQYIDDLVILPHRAIESLASLRFLEICWCPRLTSLSGVMWHLTVLEKLEINDCPMLDLSGNDNGMQFQHLRNLTSLKIKRIPKLVCLPVGLQHVTILKSLEIERCEGLIALGEWIGELRSLQRLVIFDCHKLTSLPKGMQHLTALRSLEIDGCQELDLSDDDGGMNFQGLRNLSSLTIKRSPKLKFLPEGFQYDSSLKFLEIYICENFTALPDWIGNLTSLKQLSIYGCPKLASLPKGIYGLTTLEVLSIHNCHHSLYERCRKEIEDWRKIASIPNVSLR